jgi:hypothetical protein
MGLPPAYPAEYRETGYRETFQAHRKRARRDKQDDETMTGKYVCPQLLRVKTRRQIIAGYRRKPAWKAMLRDHAHIPEAKCTICNRTHGQEYEKDNGSITIIRLTINHTDRRCYISEEAHNTWDPARMRVECTTCNWMYEKGMIPCPKCLKKGRVHYIRWDESECWSCWVEEHPEEFRKIKERKEKSESTRQTINKERAEKRRKEKVSHPCKFHRIGGWCCLSAIHSQCQYSKTKALKPVPVGCAEAVAKKRMVKA